LTRPEIIRTHPFTEEILDAHRDHAQGDDKSYWDYRGHVYYRVLNCARALDPDGDHRDEKLAITAAFHDLDAFSGLGYLAPSIRAQDAWLGGPVVRRARRSSRSSSPSTTASRPYRGVHAR
jgi:hypothetical protein